MARLKGSKNKLKQDVSSLLRLNSVHILNKCIELSLSDPIKHQVLLAKLLDKITPNLNVTTNINVSADFDSKLTNVLTRANQLREPQQVELIPETPCTLLNKEESSNEKTESYIETVQPKEDNLNDKLNEVFNKSEGVRGTSGGDGVCPNDAG